MGEEIGDSGETEGLRWTHVTCSSDEPAELFSMDTGSTSRGATAGAGAGATRAQAAAVTPTGAEIARATGTRASGTRTTGTRASGTRTTGTRATGPSTKDARSEGASAGALEVWTDGACSGNPGPGGWAWATRDGRQGSGGAGHTTNQRMEIEAAAEAVTTLTERPLVVVSDSTYVVNCFRDGWWKGWLARGWTNSQKKPVANRDLWEPLIAAYQQGGISFRWVKGHSGDEMNDLVDRLAVAAGQKQRA